MANIGIKFDGQTAYVKLPSNISSGKSIFAFSVDFSTNNTSSDYYPWSNPSIFGVEQYGNNDILLGTRNGNLMLLSGISDISANDSKNFWWNRDGDTAYDSEISVADGKIHRAVVSCDGTNISIYVDGKKLEKQISTGGKMNGKATL
jgi:hypothetical protein